MKPETSSTRASGSPAALSEIDRRSSALSKFSNSRSRSLRSVASLENCASRLATLSSSRR
jgi:hypothetical protein